MPKVPHILQSLILIVFTAIALWAQTTPQVPVGDGLSTNPYQIASLQNLLWIAVSPSSWDKNFVQTADINAAQTRTWFGGQGWIPIGKTTNKFTGSYNGKGHTIDSLYVNLSDSICIGVFGMTDTNSFIDSLGLSNENIRGSSFVGGLVGYNCGTVNACYSTGVVSGTGTIVVLSSGSYIGGLVGYNVEGVVSNCYSTVTVSGNSKSIELEFPFCTDCRYQCCSI